MPRRIVINVMALLLLGAVINVAVAWNCPLPIVGSWRQSGKSVTPYGASTAPSVWTSCRKSTWPKQPSEVHRSKDFGIDRFAFAATVGQIVSKSKIPFGPSTNIITGFVNESQCGWPMRCLRKSDVGTVEGTLQGTLPRTVLSSSALDLGTFNFGGMKFRWNKLPNGVLFPGFAINTLFYAAVCWVICFAPFALRRQLRRRRGLCPACAYPVGTSDVCTECGATVMPAQAGIQSRAADT